MKLSVIVPVYNVEKYLEETINSLGNLSDEVEIILVDDKSTDSSPSICDKLVNENKHIKVIHKNANEGLSMARNTGINNASGEYVLFMDSDDKYEGENPLDKVLGEINLSGYDMYFINMKKWWEETGKTVNTNQFDSLQLKGSSLNSLFGYIANLSSFPASASLKVIKKDILVNNNLLFTKGIYCEDIDWFFRLLVSNKVNSCGYIDICYLYRQNNLSSITSNVKDKNIDDLITIIENTKEKINVFSDDEKANLFSMLAFELMVAIRDIKFTNKNKKSYIGRIKSLLPLMKHSLDKRVKLTYVCSMLIGVSLTSKLLNLVS